MKSTSLHPAVQNALRSPSSEEHSLFRKIGPAVKEAQTACFGVMAIAMIVTVFCLAIGCCNAYTRPVLIFAVLFGSVVLYAIRSFLLYQATLSAIRSNIYQVAKGTSYYIQSAGRSDFLVYGIIGSGNQANISFFVDTDVIRAMPGDEWEFFLVATPRHTFVVIQVPYQKSHLFVTHRITSALAMPYCDPKD